MWAAVAMLPGVTIGWMRGWRRWLCARLVGKGLWCVCGRWAGGGGGDRVGVFVQTRWWWLLVVGWGAHWRGEVCWPLSSAEHMSAHVA